MTKDRVAALLGKQTARRNKLALIAAYWADGEQVEWMWAGEPYNSRLLVSIEGGSFQACKSYDEDIRPLLKDK